MTTVTSYYFKWLVDLISDEQESSRYNNLLETLFSIVYYWDDTDRRVRFDKYRVNDCMQLRENFCVPRKIPLETLNYNISGSPELNGEVRVLEVLVSLAMTCEDRLMHDPDMGDRTDVWFWSMLDNLGLTDRHFEDSNWHAASADEACEIVDRMLKRDYKEDGYGSLFPIPGSGDKQFGRDLWKQMNAWVIYEYSI